MDPLDVIGNIQNCIPHYQAICSADKQEVIGYEVLGRIRTENGVHSLGSFFLDESVPDEFKIEVDRTIIEKALQQVLSNNILLFINQRADILLNGSEETLLSLLLQFANKGVSLDKIVLEVGGTELIEDKESLINLLQYYKTFGIKIAISQLSGTQLSILSKIEPSIIKVDVNILRQSHEMSDHQDVLHSISVLARKIGATLLYENIEASFQLQYAWRNGGRYYQGYYLHKPSEVFLEVGFIKEKLKEKFQQFIRHEKRKLEGIQRLSDEIQLAVQSFLSKNKAITDLNQWLMSLSEILHKYSFRMYICDDDGFQRSANLVKQNNNWYFQHEFVLNNWSWRPYFLENIMKMRTERKGILSDVYNDIETKDPIRTFSYPLSNGLYLYIDLSYEYLYELNDI